MGDYVDQLEKVIKQMLSPLKEIPLKLVIESLCNHTIIPYDPSDSRDVSVLKNLVLAAGKAGIKINKNGIQRRRANEVGNDIEQFIKSALSEVGYSCQSPKTINGHQKAMGYPDLEFIDEFGRTNYLECKTYNIQNIGITMRSFYLSPSEDHKITKDAHHFLISLEMIEEKRGEALNQYKCKGWKILSLEKLLVDVKYEFNSDNARLYTKDLILAEGQIV